jgi:general secretion pathway protein G
MVVNRESSSLLRSGFTLIELLVAIAILALLAGGAVPFALNQLNKARESTAKTDMQTFKGALTMYQMGMSKYPQTLKDLVRAPREEQDKKRWKQAGGPFIGTEGDNEIKEDPWGNPYKYKPTPGTPRPYELYSYGKNGPGSPKEEQLSVWDK